MKSLIYFTNHSKIEVLPDNTVRLTNYRENEKIYLLDARRFYELLKCGGKRWKIPNKNGTYTELTFNLDRHHISSVGGGINTYINPHDYKFLMQDLGIIIEPEFIHHCITRIDFDNL